jgi:hypothetical protein
MPEILDRCVTDIMAKWKKDPSKRPKPIVKEGQKPPSMRSQAFAICTASLKKAGKLEEISLEGVGPTILGCAATNRPHIKGLPPIAQIDEDGKAKFVVPMLRRAKFRHSSGVLDFTGRAFDKMISNYKENVAGIDIALDARHKPDLGALGWFEDVYEKDGILYAKVVPTKLGLDFIGEQRYKYASVEFHPNWQDPELKMSLDDIEELLEIEFEEVTMPDNDEVRTMTEEEYTEFVDARKALEEQIDSIKNEHAEEIRSLRESYGEVVTRLEAQAVRQMVSGIMLEAEHYRDDRGMGHPKFLLEWARSVLSFDEIEGEEPVKLEDREDPVRLRAYVRKSVVALLKGLPGSVPLSDGETERDKERSVELEGDGITDEQLSEYTSALWGS